MADLLVRFALVGWRSVGVGAGAVFSLSITLVLIGVLVPQVAVVTFITPRERNINANLRAIMPQQEIASGGREMLFLEGDKTQAANRRSASGSNVVRSSDRRQRDFSSDAIDNPEEDLCCRSERARSP